MKIEKVNGKENMLHWNAEIVSLWFNSQTGKLITNYDFSDNEHNVSHYNMFNYYPEAFGFDEISFKKTTKEINECDDSNAFYHIMMNRGWVRVGRNSKENKWYFYHNEWGNEVIYAVNALILALHSPGVRAYRTDGSSVDLFISDIEIKIRFGWSEIPDTIIRKIVEREG